MPAAHAGVGHCTTVPSPLRPQVHNFTSGYSRSVIDCAGKPVFTPTLCPRYGAVQILMGEGSVSRMATGYTELGNPDVQNRAA